MARRRDDTLPSEREDYTPPITPPPGWPSDSVVECLLGAVQRRLADGRATAQDHAYVDNALRRLMRSGETAWIRHAHDVARALNAQCPIVYVQTELEAA